VRNRKNLILTRHLGTIHHIWLMWLYLAPSSIADQNKNSLKKTDCKRFANFKVTPLKFMAAILYLTKKIFYEICVTLIQTVKKPEAENIRNSLKLW
jgi:hypothetical protein